MPESPPRILLAHPRMGRVSGGNGVSMWIAETLLDAGCEVTLATLSPPAIGAHDAAFGTRLDGRAGFQVRIAPGTWRAALRLWPTAGAELEAALCERWTRRLWRRGGFDGIVSGHNEMDMPRPGLQYVHFPRHWIHRPDHDRRWFHAIPGVLTGYHALVRAVGIREDNWSAHRTLVNSGFVERAARQSGFRDVRVVHPPVFADPSPIPWYEREDRVVVIGRIHRAKRVREMLDMVIELHRRGLRPTATLVGPWDCDPAYRSEIEALLATHSWLEHRDDLDRAALQRLLHRSRWGLHRMQDEHFGMGVAEMLRSGMVVFAHASGGPREILGEDDRLLYDDDPGGVERMATAMADPALAEELHRNSVARADRFSIDTFRSAILEEVARLLPAHEAVR